MIDQGIAKANPELGVPRVPPNGIFQNADRVFALAVAFQRFGHPKPALRRREIAVEGVPSVGKRKDVMSLAAYRPSSGKIRATLQGVPRCTDEQGCSTRGQQPTPDAKQPEEPEAQCDKKQERTPAHLVPLHPDSISEQPGAG